MSKIFIAAGHSNTDPGAAYNGMKESDLAVRLQNRIAVNLRALGMQVLTDGEGEINKPLLDAVSRARIITAAGGVAVEIHFNAGPATAKGVEALGPDRLLVLCQRLAFAVAHHTGSPRRGNLGFKSPSQSARKRLAFCDAGGIILEVAFISNPDEMAAYLLRENEIAQAISDTLFEHQRKPAHYEQRAP